MRNIYTILKKELKRFFTDYRMIMTLLLPGIMIFILYSLMGTFMAGITTSDENYIFEIVIVNNPNEEEFTSFVNFDLLDVKTNIVYLTQEDDSYKDLIANKELDLYIVYPLNFYDDAINHETSNGDESPNIKIYFNSSKTESYEIYNGYFFLLDNFKDSISEKFTINKSDDIFNLATKEQNSIFFIISLVPFLLIIFLYSGAMSVSIESIAGEKERGTIATILATPIRRSELVLGKTFALSIAALVGATSSFLGLILSLPKLAGDANLDFSMYGFSEFFLLFLVLTTTTILYVVLISIISTYSKSVKEASGLSAVLMILNMIIGVTSMSGKVSQNSVSYLIPVFNSLQSVTQILSTNINTTHLLITFLSNILYIVLGVFVLTKMFNNENIMFNK